MSDDTLNIDFGDRELDFSKAKELPQPRDGGYEFVVDDYKLKPSKDDPKCLKGVNVSLVLKFADPYSIVSLHGDEEDFSSFKAFDNIYLYWDNPFGAKPFYEAILRRELTESIPFKNVSDYIGERVGAVLVQVPHYLNPKKTQTKIAKDSYYSV